MDLYKFIHIFINELNLNNIENSSIYIYIYFKTLYNINSFFCDTIVPDINIQKNIYIFLKSKLITNKELKPYVFFITTQHLLSLFFKNYSNKHLLSIDFNINNINLGVISDYLLSIVNDIYELYKNTIELLNNYKINDWGQPADYSGKPEYKISNIKEWCPLVIPTGNENLIDVNYSNTFRIQKSKFINYNIENTIVKYNLDQIENQIQIFREKLPFPYELDTTNPQTIHQSNFFYNTNIVYYMFYLAINLNNKFKLNIDNQINIFYTLAIKTYNTSIIIFSLKNKYNLPRPININREVYKNTKMNIWYNKNLNNGIHWLPINNFNIVCPEYSDCPDEFTTLATVLGLTLKKLYPSQNIYDGITRNIVNNKLLGKHKYSSEKYTHLSSLETYNNTIIIKNIDNLIELCKYTSSNLGISYKESCEIGYNLGKLLSE